MYGSRAKLMMATRRTRTTVYRISGADMVVSPGVLQLLRQGFDWRLAR
jgi:hypothetical protein